MDSFEAGVVKRKKKKKSLGLEMCTPSFSNVIYHKFSTARLVIRSMGKTSTSCQKRYIENIYFFVVNTKYISLNVLKISVISRVRSTSDIADIFNT